ncbi:MAG: hypothetical protein UU49_C0006G0046 [Candidatus Magasanikbacteria bacterium GW2011_GWC2_41_17]|uniref:Uncharacterized protein n=2 Tax=Candidatus Magasanikiibacteriota TaxID=1752731 RepID=A0A0G0YV32_9BACT|nr:MAG: hypothetical protein UU49_C0006G0046 [Candidatus Magasanikbacteria bacterium GW2011_GWC2_41_17]KKS13531.1 MAG: hypothetical protein UU69_C0003G0028 [Candidatus Magasanikbacteria bacterium GW2011_GWA2_41_55]
MDTMTKTQSVSATKLAVATAVLFVAGGLAMATLPGQQGEKSAGPISGSSLVKVTSCEQKGADIEVSRNNSPKYMMKAGCKNTGNGFLNYTYQCMSGGVASSTPGTAATSAAYKVFWAPCSSITILPNADTLKATGGVVTVGANKLLAVFDFAAYIKESTITSLVLTKTGTIKNENLTNIKLTDVNGFVLSGSHFSPLSPDKLAFTFNKVVPTNAIVATKLMISADISNAALNGDTLSLGINSISDVGTTSYIGVSLPVTYGPVTVNKAEAILSVAWTMDTPSGVSAPSGAQILGKLKFSNSGGATQETATINSLTIQGASTFPVSGWKLYKDSVSDSPLAEGQIVADESSTSTFKVVFSNFETMIAGSQDKTFFIAADTTAVTKLSQSSLVAKFLSVQVKSASDIGSSVTVKDQFPLQSKTFTY